MVRVHMVARAVGPIRARVEAAPRLTAGATVGGLDPVHATRRLVEGPQRLCRHPSSEVGAQLEAQHTRRLALDALDDPLLQERAQQLAFPSGPGAHRDVVDMHGTARQARR